MNVDIAAGAKSRRLPFPIQYVTAEITPLIGGQFSVVMQATLLDEEELEFVGQDLANAHVDTLDEALAVIRANVTALNPPPSERWHEEATMNTAALNNTDRIRVLNDNFRSTFVGGQVVMTAGVNALPIDTKARVLLAVQSFSNFTKDNDPHGEHDFGNFEIDGETYFFKIDLYEEPEVKDSNGEPVVNRVLTIMLADEY